MKTIKSIELKGNGPGFQLNGDELFKKDTLVKVGAAVITRLQAKKKGITEVELENMTEKQMIDLLLK